MKVGTEFTWTHGNTWVIDGRPAMVGGLMVIQVRCIKSTQLSANSKPFGLGEIIRLPVDSLESILKYQQ